MRKETEIFLLLTFLAAVAWLVGFASGLVVSR